MAFFACALDGLYQNGIGIAADPDKRCFHDCYRLKEAAEAFAREAKSNQQIHICPALREEEFD
ncbi:hypothetical protein [Mesorhizobium waimense]|uniref:hypothetical protein n=1 Tax=Mesorhizobium waimense TaxID=1300307 RepID=UPI0011C40792|nr:hypothetical protein [Mesorhizobium waimense]